MTSEFAIETDGLEKTYRSLFGGGEVKAVSNLTLRVPVGVKYGLLGPNGAGKTTFVKMLLSAVHPTGGSASLLGRDAHLPEARRAVGYLPENHRFPTYFTGSGMLHFYAALSGVPRSERRKRIHSMLKLVGLSHWGSVRLRKYSKGMLQRLGLAQALMHHPRLLILDEPTDGVDPAGRREIHDILNRLIAKGVTVFINSHLLSEVESFCDYVAIMRKGSLALDGKMSDLLAKTGFTVNASHVSTVFLNEIRASGATILRNGSGVAIQTPTSDHANLVMDKIRAAGGSIESFAPSNTSLEQLFLELTSERGD